MDALSDVLRVVRLTGGVFLEAEFSAPWCVTSQVGPEDCRPHFETPAHLIAYHYIVDGRLVLQVDDDALVEAAAGELVMLPRNDRHTLGSAPDLSPVPGDALVEAPRDGGLAVIRHGGGGEVTRIVCGFIGSETPFNPVIVTLPRVLKLNVAESIGGEWIASSFRYAASEVGGGRIGSRTVLSKLSELLFVEAVRRYLAVMPAEATGWLAGLRDHAVGRALALLHGRVAEPWTTEALAQEVGLSRSAFADRFTVLVGTPPMRYLASWRMQVAARVLRESERSIAQTAAAVGYESEAAFNRAFKREFGVPPATWRGKRRQP